MVRSSGGRKSSDKGLGEKYNAFNPKAIRESKGLKLGKGEVVLEKES